MGSYYKSEPKGLFMRNFLSKWSNYLVSEASVYPDPPRDWDNEEGTVSVAVKQAIS